VFREGRDIPKGAAVEKRKREIGIWVVGDGRNQIYGEWMYLH
jgi:hypothetical protein